jgi:serine protease Do
MAYRRLRISIWLVGLALFATWLVGSSARPQVLTDIGPVLRIVTPEVSEVVTEDVTPQTAEALHMSCLHGVMVSRIMSSELSPGDVILAVNGVPVNSQCELNAELAKVAFGESFTLDIYRDGGTGRVTVQRAMETALVSKRTAESRGISVAGLSTGNGVMVAQVQVGTAASSLGLKSGDIILDVDGQPVHSAAEFMDFMRQLGNKDAKFNVRHQNGEVNVFILAA